MKKLYSVIIAVLLAIAFGTTAFAADYYNEEAEFSLDLPDDCFVLYPEMTEEYFAQYKDIFGWSYAEFMDYFAEYEYACEIYSFDDESEISVWIMDFDFTDYSEETEASLKSDLVYMREILDESAEIIESEIYRSEKTAFLKYSLIYDDGGMYNEIYITINNGKMIYLELYTFADTVTPAQSARFKAIIDGMSFGKTQPSEQDSVQALGQNKFYIEEAKLTVTAPDGYIVNTLDHYDERVENIIPGITEEILKENFESNSIYFNAASEDLSHEFTMIVDESAYTDFSTANKTMLQTTISIMENAYKENGIIVTFSEIYECSGTKFIKLVFEHENTEEKGAVFITSNDNKLISVNVKVYSGEVTEEYLSTLTEIVESIEFDIAPQQELTAEETEAFVYTDEKSGISFTVPKNWAEYPLDGDEEFVMAKFASVKETGMMMNFGVMSFDEAAKDEGMWFVDFSDIDNEFFTEKDLAEALELPEENIEKVTVAGKEYYKIKYEATNDLLGIEFATNITAFWHIENGWMYQFIFGGTEENEYYSDFISLIESIKYPEPQADAVQEENGILNSLILIAPIAVVAVVVIIVIIVVKKKSRSNVAKIETAQTEMPQEQPVPGHNYCTLCGAKLREGSSFCQECGAPVEK